MHELRVSEGIVLGKRGVGEANSLLAILTEEMGLVRASARSTRVEQSKLRFGLEPLTLARFSFVRGRHEWKLTGVEDISSGLLSSTSVRRRSAGRVAKLTLRLIHGEEILPALYIAIREGLRVLARAEADREAESIELILVLRILSHLGYVPVTAELAPFVESDLFLPELLARAYEKKSFLIRTINDSLSATGL